MGQKFWFYWNFHSPRNINDRVIDDLALLLDFLGPLCVFNFLDKIRVLILGYYILVILLS